MKRLAQTALSAAWLLGLGCGASAQSVDVSASLGYAHSTSLGSGSLGGRVAALVVRTRSVSVGGELGYFAAGSERSVSVTRDPVFGVVSSTYEIGRDFWVGAAVSRYRIGRAEVGGAYAILSTGLYLPGTTERVDERNLDGVPVRAGAAAYRRRGLVPGVGGGLGAAVPVGLGQANLELELRLHALIGADDGIYPVVTVTAGLQRLVRCQRY